MQDSIDGILCAEYGTMLTHIGDTKKCLVLCFALLQYGDLFIGYANDTRRMATRGNKTRFRKTEPKGNKIMAITRDDLINGNEFHWCSVLSDITTEGMNIRKCRKWRRNGKTKTWKRNPDRIEVPVKYGIYSYRILTQNEIRQNWFMPNECPACIAERIKYQEKLILNAANEMRIDATKKTEMPESNNDNSGFKTTLSFEMIRVGSTTVINSAEIKREEIAEWLGAGDEIITISKEGAEDLFVNLFEFFRVTEVHYNGNMIDAWNECCKNIVIA